MGYIIRPYIHGVFSLASPAFSAMSLYALDSQSSGQTGLTLPCLLAGSLYTSNMCPLFHYAAYAAARTLSKKCRNAPIELKTKLITCVSFFTWRHTLHTWKPELRLK